MRVVTVTSFVITFIASKAYAEDSILHNFPQFPPLPAVTQTTIQQNGISSFTNATKPGPGALNLNIIQADILIGMRKDKQIFSFFHINNPASFKKKLQVKVAPLITSTAQLLGAQFKCPESINFAISHSGLNALNVTGDLGDTSFPGGQFADAVSLGDPGTDQWVSAFKGTNIHGVFSIASDDWDKINAARSKLVSTFGSDATFVYDLKGQVRPGDEAGHEHFGFMDGISQPAIEGFTTTPFPGQTIVKPGFFLFGEDGDSLASSRPAWAKDGTFLAFRQLQQLVPEFHKFVADRAAENGMSSDLLGARLIGRWQSGAPVDLSPTQDNATLAADPQLNNNFTFSHPGDNIKTDQSKCPFTAHIRKTRPRADFAVTNTANHIIRAGIPYGPEVTYQEAATNKTTIERGLAFVSYQTNLNLGFRFLQRIWANNPNFFFDKNITAPGADPLIGSLDKDTNVVPRNVSGLVTGNPDKNITFPTHHIVSRGGEYFFVPSIDSIRNGFPN